LPRNQANKTTQISRPATSLTEIPERGTPRYGHATLQQRLPRPLTRKPHIFVNHANRNISGGSGTSEDAAREYPWYAAWDLAFHAVAISVVDMDFAKAQLLLMLNEMYQHPNGQVLAYEWNFGDVNPPVHAWAAFFISWSMGISAQGRCCGAVGGFVAAVTGSGDTKRTTSARELTGSVTGLAFFVA
jgi:hypothetical protein